MLIFKKEKEVRKLILDHISTTHDCLTASRSVLEQYIGGDFETLSENALKVKKLEQQADLLKREARSVLQAGAFLPHIRSDIHRLVEFVDEVAGACEEVAKFLLYQSPQIPEEFEAEILEISSMCVTCFNELRKALKDFFKPKGDIESLHEHAEKVGILESEIDDKQAQLTRQVFDSEMELAAKLHFGQLIRLISSVSDLSEDVADELESVVMKSVV